MRIARGSVYKYYKYLEAFESAAHTLRDCKRVPPSRTDSLLRGQLLPSGSAFAVVTPEHCRCNVDVGTPEELPPNIENSVV